MPGSAYEIFALSDLANPLFSNVLGGVSVDFTTLAAYAAGISGFQLRGINPKAGLDPANPFAFVTGLTYASDGRVALSQNPLTSSIPEPSTWMMFILGFGLLGAALRSRRTPTPLRA